jgi:hypothetical protein
METKDNQLVLTDKDGVNFSFIHVPMNFAPARYANVFAGKNNKTVRETLQHRRYEPLKPLILDKYRPFLEFPLGRSLLKLKEDGDPAYLSFLNRYGDLTYSKFSITDERWLATKGVYAWFSGPQLKYIGRCRDSLKKRVNQGYGHIHPKNCYLDGQATNCHLNSLVSLRSRLKWLWIEA